ncbi:hypothetical protein DM860_015037 [Cuscuta australis]|uniref:Uncharacterized protein n=1 Tax=Cuscuta australis TaxID=267555 RepID=A0A328DF76_9ASTE|nr:hypothetical protein DM860_015037 [Cuscuta australis]
MISSFDIVRFQAAISSREEEIFVPSRVHRRCYSAVGLPRRCWVLSKTRRSPDSLNRARTKREVAGLLFIVRGKSRRVAEPRWNAGRTRDAVSHCPSSLPDGLESIPLVAQCQLASFMGRRV